MSTSVAAVESTTIAGKKRSGYLPTLDGWRALSILAVLFHHAPLLHLGPFSTRWLYDEGAFGVQIFFAISGFLICGRLLEEEARTGTLHLRGFYIRRVLRIQPAALAFLFAVLLAKLASLVVLSWGGLFAALALVRNYLPWNAVGPVDYVTSHFWSLSVEEHFYLLLPAFLLFVRRRRVRLLLLASGLLLVWNLFCIRHNLLGPQSYHRTDLCLNMLLFPAALAVLLRRPQFRSACERFLQPWVAFLVALLILIPMWAAWRHAFRTGAVLVPALLVLSTMLHPQSPFSRLLETKPLRFVGRISYGLYLWQQLFVTGHFVPQNPALGFLTTFPASFLVSFALAMASYYWLELPCMRLGHRLARPAVEGRPELGAQVP